MHALTAGQVADLLTLSRLAIGIAMIWFGAIVGQPAVGAVACLLILSWTSDSLDGPIARRGSQEERTHFGDHDLVFDIIVALGLLGYIVLARILPWGAAASYLALWALVFYRWGFNRSLGMLVQAPIYLWFLILSLQRASMFGYAILAWIVLVVAITWPRFPREVVPGFLGGMRQMAKQDQLPR